MNGFYGSGGAHGHKNGRLDASVIRFNESGSGVAIRCLMFQGEFHGANVGRSRETSPIFRTFRAWK